MKQLFAALMMSVMLVTVGTAAGPKMLSKKEVKTLVANASTPADHRTSLPEHYRTVAEKLDAESKEHAEMAKTYRAHPTVSETKRPGATRHRLGL